MQPHAIVWLDHRTARVIRFSRDTSEITEIHGHQEGKLHRKSGPRGSGHMPDDVAFFDEVAAALEVVPEVIVAGPGTAKKAFEAHVAERHPDLARRIVASETMDHPTDGELLAHARTSFHRIDQLGLGGGSEQ